MQKNWIAPFMVNSETLNPQEVTVCLESGQHCLNHWTICNWTLYGAHYHELECVAKRLGGNLQEQGNNAAPLKKNMGGTFLAAADWRIQIPLRKQWKWWGAFWAQFFTFQESNFNLVLPMKNNCSLSCEVFNFWPPNFVWWYIIKSHRSVQKVWIGHCKCSKCDMIHF